MTAAYLLTLIIAAMNGTGTVSGMVTTNNAPAVNAHVFLELGLDGDLISTRSDAQGRFAFTGVDSGTAGVFALTDGYAFGGDTVTLGIGTEIADLNIQLKQPATVDGYITDFQGNSIVSAEIRRALIIDGDAKVGIPLTKLSNAGIATPTSDENGRFVVPRMPQGADIILKAAHPDYAQAAKGDIRAGDSGVAINLHRGVLIYGNVVTRGTGQHVANAVIAFSSAHPPNETSITRTNLQGEFEIRLNPGVYLYRAEGEDFRSPAWERLTIQGESPTRGVTLTVARMGRISGAVRNALNEAPIENAKIKVVAGGEVAGVFRTGPQGAFDVPAASGLAEVYLEAAPGYLPPEQSGLRIEVTEGEAYQLPTFWLRPIPDFRVAVYTASGEPAPNIALRLVRPEQIGWYVTDSNGTASVRLQGWPSDGSATGWAEDPERPQLALFSLNQRDTEGAGVRLLDAAKVSGTVVNAKDKELAGATVGFYAVEDPDRDPILLWRCRTDKNGRFQWDAAPPRVPIRCVAYTGDASNAASAPSGESAPTLLSPGDYKDLGNVVVPDGERGDVLIGKKIAWRELPHQAGAVPNADDDRPAVVIYCTAVEAPVVIEALARVHNLGPLDNIACAVVVDGDYSDPSPPFPILRGTAPGIATTYYLDARGRVALESYGMPDFAALRRLTAGALAP